MSFQYGRVATPAIHRERTMQQTLSFLKPRANPLRSDPSAMAAKQLSPQLKHILVTTALLESRAHLYSGYLAAVFARKDGRWHLAVRQWNEEEAQHGRVLMRLAARLPLHDKPAALFERYLADVPYHARRGVSVRGSVGRELVARCVVEALASTYYRVLADAVDAPALRETFTLLARDEARHFGMFRRMLLEECDVDAKLSTASILLAALQRMIALEDEQISYASYLVSGGAVFSCRRQSHIYARTLYPLYRYRHLHYAAGMLLLILNHRSSQLQHALAALLWLGVRARSALAAVMMQLPGASKIRDVEERSPAA